MKKKQRNRYGVAVSLLAAFALWTALVCCVDVQPIGPDGSAVGFAAVNEMVHDLTGVHMGLYVATDLLSLVPVAFVVGFAVLGLAQWMKRKSFLRVDGSILLLGGYFVAVMALYVFFEVVVINYRPVLINGVLEASYPSSTTMLVMCVMPTAWLQLNARMKSGGAKKLVTGTITAYTAFMVVGRLISGVHWFSDIVGGALLSAGLAMLYGAAAYDLLQTETGK